MLDLDIDALRRKLADLGRRIDAQTHELADKGVSKSAHDKRSAGLRRRHDDLCRKVEDAIQSDDKWRVLRAELERDLEGIRAELVSTVERLDADSAKAEFDELEKLKNSPGTDH